jgi:hypothetical protein
VWRPKWLWSLLGCEKNVKYDQGLFKRGDNQMFVSKRLGYQPCAFQADVPAGGCGGAFLKTVHGLGKASA